MNNQYVLDATHLLFERSESALPTTFEIERAEECLVTTVDENESAFTRREVNAAKQAREMMRRMGYVSLKDQAAMIKHGAIINCPVTQSDVYRAHQIYGSDVASLKGKTKATPSHIVKIEHVPRSLETNQTLHVDVIFIEGDPYLLSVSTPLGLTMATHLGGDRSERTLLKALLSQIDKYKAQHFIISNIKTDMEGGVMAIADIINSKGITLHPAGPGEHVPVIENKAKQVKERTRAHLNVLPFILASSLLIWLVSF